MGQAKRKKREPQVDGALDWMDEANERVVKSSRRLEPPARSPARPSGRQPQEATQVPRLSRRDDLLGDQRSSGRRRLLNNSSQTVALSAAERRSIEEQKRRTQRLKQRQDAVADAAQWSLLEGEGKRSSSARPRQESTRSPIEARRPSGRETGRREQRPERDRPAAAKADMERALAWMDDAGHEEVVRGRRPAAQGPKTSKTVKVEADKTSIRDKSGKRRSAASKPPQAPVARRRPVAPDRQGFIDEVPDERDIYQPGSEIGSALAGDFLDEAPRSKRLYPKPDPQPERHDAAGVAEDAATSEARLRKAQALLGWMEEVLGDATPPEIKALHQRPDRKTLEQVLRAQGRDLLRRTPSGRFDRQSIELLEQLFRQAGNGQLSFSDYVSELERIVLAAGQRPAAPTPAPAPRAERGTRSSRVIRLEEQLRRQSRPAAPEAPAARRPVEPLPLERDPFAPDPFDDPFAAVFPTTSLRDESDPFLRRPDPLQDPLFGSAATSDPFARDPFAGDPFAQAAAADPFAGDPFARAAEADPFARPNPYLTPPAAAPTGWNGASTPSPDLDWADEPFSDPLGEALPRVSRRQRDLELASSSSSIDVLM